MVYNSQNEKLIISEYGRNVQNLINYCKTIEDEGERQSFAEAIVDLMHQMNPTQRNNQEYKEKLWHHLFRIANYDIEVKPTIGDVPDRDSDDAQVRKLEYPQSQRSFRQYGQLVKDLINKAIEMEDEEKRDEFVMVIASYMKLAYRTWNKQHYVNDEMIKGDIISLSEGKLKIPEERAIEVHTSHSGRKSRRSGGQSSQRPGSRHHRSNKRRR